MWGHPPIGDTWTGWPRHCLSSTCGVAQEAPDLGQWEGQDVPLVKPSSCIVKRDLPSSKRYLTAYLFHINFLLDPHPNHLPLRGEVVQPHWPVVPVDFGDTELKMTDGDHVWLHNQGQCFDPLFHSAYPFQRACLVVGGLPSLPDPVAFFHSG